MHFWNVSSRLISFMDSSATSWWFAIFELIASCTTVLWQPVESLPTKLLMVQLRIIPNVFDMHKFFHYCLQSPSAVPKSSCNWRQPADLPQHHQFGYFQMRLSSGGQIPISSRVSTSFVSTGKFFLA